MKHKKTVFKVLALIVLLAVLLYSAKYRDISKVRQVVGVSVDRAWGGRYIFGLEYADSDKQGNFTVKSKRVSVVANDLSEALAQAGLQGEYPLSLTGGSLVVICDDLLSSSMSDISEILLRQWTGRSDASIAVSDGSAAAILSAGKHTDLRSGQLNAQLCRAGGVSVTEGASRYLQGEALSLPLVRADEEDYSISGSIEIMRT